MAAGTYPERSEWVDGRSRAELQTCELVDGDAAPDRLGRLDLGQAIPVNWRVSVVGILGIAREHR